MRSAFQILPTLLLWLMRLIQFGITYALFSYLAHFTEVQSVVLAVVTLYALSGYRLAARIAAKQPPEFVPFRVCIELDWYSLCRDFGLADVEKDDLLEMGSRPHLAKYSIFHSGINFTMLNPTLFYFDDHKTFFGRIDWIPLPDFAAELQMSSDRALYGPTDQPIRKSPDVDHRSTQSDSGLFSPFSSPHFYIKQSVAGDRKRVPVIEFGIGGLLKKMLLEGGGADVLVARLPEVVLDNLSSSQSDYDRMQKINKKSKERLAEFGWTHTEREIEHKYLRITYRGLS